MQGLQHVDYLGSKIFRILFCKMSIASCLKHHKVRLAILQTARKFFIWKYVMQFMFILKETDSDLAQKTNPQASPLTGARGTPTLAHWAKPA